MRFAVVLPWWGYLLVAGACVAVAVATYAGTPLQPRRRAALTALRAAALLLLAAAVLRPVRVVPPSGARDRVLPILVDVSRSMRVADSAGPARLQRAIAAVSRLETSAAGVVRTEVWAFGDGASRSTLGAMQASAGRSDLGGALRTISEHYRGRPLAGLVVVSDGGETSPEHDGDLPAPVFAIGVGSPRIGRDREVVGLSAGEPRLADSTVDVQVSAVSTGFGTQPLEFTLTANGRPVDVRTVPVVDGAPVSTVFTVSPDPAVPTVYRVSVPVAPGEIAAENNARSVLVEPPGRRRRLLLVEGAPGYEHTFLKRALARDSSLDVDAVIRKGQTDEGQPTFFVQAAASRAPALAAGYPRTRADLFAYDAVVFGNVEAAFFTREQLEATAAFVAARGGGLLVLGGRSFERGGLAGTPLEEVLPVDPSDRRAGVARASLGSAVAGPSVQLTPDGAAHPATRIGVTPDDARRRWAALPPLASVSLVGGPRAGAQVLARAEGGDGRPLVAVQRYGQGRTAVFAGEASWRWRMMLPAADTSYDTIWRQMTRWLSRGALDPVSVAPLGSPSPGTSETVSVLVRDRDYAAVGDAEVQITVTAPGGDERRLPASLADAADGRYEVTVRFPESGVYRLAADARRGADVVGRAERVVLAGGADPEMADPRLNEAVLRRLADRTGGLYVGPDEVTAIPARLAGPAAVDGPPELRDLWHGAWSLLAVIGLLGAEWTSRRRAGLA
ncbi:MAG: glutamine amidotransferase [Vicinamibacterales bacterium]